MASGKKVGVAISASAVVGLLVAGVLRLVSGVHGSVWWLTVIGAGVVGMVATLVLMRRADKDATRGTSVVSGVTAEGALHIKDVEVSTGSDERTEIASGLKGKRGVKIEGLRVKKEHRQSQEHSDDTD